MKKYCLFMLMVAFFVFGCKQRVVTQPETQPQQQTEKQKADAAESGKTSERVTEKIASSDVKSTEQSAADSKAGKEGMFKDVLFDFDKYDVKEEFRPIVKSLGEWMLKNTSAALSLEGHCDDRGTNEYNLALGDRRAKAVKDFLVSLGVPSSRIETLSYGEEKPLCSEQTEDCWAQNRRAHFVIMGGTGK